MKILIKILIIEDNPANMKLVSDVLQMKGYTILQVGDADSGIRLANEELPVLILMDIQLPGMDGISAAKTIKENEKTKDIPIVALTAIAMKGDKEKFMRTGYFADYIAKPISYKELQGTVARILKEG